ERPTPAGNGSVDRLISPKEPAVNGRIRERPARIYPSLLSVWLVQLSYQAMARPATTRVLKIVRLGRETPIGRHVCIEA
ncbi:MAG: hypothetical protein VYD17_03975, partial [Pseudomonadota bacterium]|nr:hypothetical protein [Pseudomonadota bacterium]